MRPISTDMQQRLFEAELIDQLDPAHELLLFGRVLDG